MYGFRLPDDFLIGTANSAFQSEGAVDRDGKSENIMEYFAKEIQLIAGGMHDFSFPSGHTIASFEACTVLMLGNKKFGIPATILAILVAFSRLYLYLHYPTDVIVSIILGTLFGILGYALAQKCNLRNPFRKGKYQK